MEVNINKDIRKYTEKVFFGLSMRQFIFSALAVAVAVVLYLRLEPIVGAETVSWMCVLGAAPFGAMGFISYHGMTAEQFVWTWLRSELLEPRLLKYEATTLYHEMHKAQNKRKGARRRDVKDASKTL